MILFTLSFLIYIFSSLLTLALVMYYLDDYTLSNNKFIYFLQKYWPFLFILFIMLSFSYVWLNVVINFQDYLFHVVDPDNNNIDKSLTINAEVSLNENAARELGKGISGVGSNVGLAASITGVAAATGKSIGKSALSPFQKVGVVIGSAIIGAGLHVGASAINSARSVSNLGISSGGKSSSGGGSSFNRASNFLPTDDSLIAILCNSILYINMACIYLIIILAIQILAKLFIKDNLNINLSFLLGDRYNNTFNYYLNKVISLNKQTSNVIIFIILFVVIIGLSGSSYFLYELINNLDLFINLYKS